MNIPTIKEHLTYLRDNTLVNNLDGISRIDLILRDLDNPAPQPKVVQEIPSIPADRRAEERDPGENDQHVAEKVGLVAPPVRVR